MTAPVLFDSHAHLDFKVFRGEVDAVLERAADAGVGFVTTVGVGRDRESLGRARDLAARYPNVHATCGVHPHDAKYADEDLLAQLETIARSAEVKAVGETGLDYHYLRSPRETQQEVFRAQLRLARELQKPVVLHLREAHRDAVAILREEWSEGMSGIVHCYSSGPDELPFFLELGFYISFSGILTYPTAEPLRLAAAATPADRLLVETDAPYLAPVPRRGKTNEPAWVAYTARRLAEVRGEPFEHIAEVTTRNAHLVYGLNVPMR
jgi:TatD DNase family protein